MTFEDLILRNRSYRRYDHSQLVNLDTLRTLVDVARRTPSTANRQPLKYVFVDGEDRCAKMFPFTKWGGALKGWTGPAPTERPGGYVVVLGDTSIMKESGVDCGIACQSMLLAAAERGLGGCMLGAIDRDGIRRMFAIPERFDILLVVALGTPAETCVIEDAAPGADITYYRDAAGVHHVPKRPMEDVVLKL
jgi:nitroreductase